jgi:flagellin
MRIGEIGAGGVFASSLRRIQIELQLSNEKLAKNTELVHPAQDPARFTLAMRLRGQISGHAAAQRNAQDGYSMTSAVSETLTSLRDLITEARSLADEWNSGTGDKDAIHTRIGEISDQITSEIATARFGDHALAQGGAPVSLMIGPDAGSVMDIALPDAAALIGSSVTDFEAAGPLAVIDTASLDAATDGIDGALGQNAAYASRLEHAISFADGQIEALTRGEGRIMDLDVAKETAHNTALLIREQFNMALLAQANDQSREMFKILLGR